MPLMVTRAFNERLRCSKYTGVEIYLGVDFRELFAKLRAADERNSFFGSESAARFYCSILHVCEFRRGWKLGQSDQTVVYEV